MTALDDLKAAEQQEATDIGKLTVDIGNAISAGQAAAGALKNQIAALQAQIAAGGGVTAADLSGLQTLAQQNDAAIQAADAAVNAAAANLNPPK